MPTRAFLAAILVGSGVIVSAAEASAPLGTLQGLVDHSPFGDSTNASSINPAMEPALEFRGVLEENGIRLFSIYNKSTHRSVWVEMNIPGNGYSVKNYDEKQPSISVEYQGLLLPLPLTRGRVTAQIPSIAPAPTAPAIPAAVANPRFDPATLKLKQEESRRRHQQSAVPAARP